MIDRAFIPPTLDGCAEVINMVIDRQGATVADVSDALFLVSMTLQEISDELSKKAD